MSLTERFRPQKIDDLVGNPTAIKRLVKAIENNKPILLWGPPGIGKTSAVYAYAKEKNYKVYELNASDKRKKEDMESVLRQLQSNLFFPTIFLLDEVDGAESFKAIEGCVKNARHPLVLVCNNVYKIPKSIQQLCETIRFYNPRLTEVSKLIERIEKSTGKKANYGSISHDIRNSILCAFYGGEKYQTEDDYGTIGGFFRKGETKKLEEKHFIWLLDNGCENFKGSKLYKFHQLLALCGLTDRFDALQIIGRGRGKVTYPRYFRRLKVLRGAKKK